MKIAFVHQPFGTISPSAPSGSIDIWIYEVARRLAQSMEVIVYSKRGYHQSKIEKKQGVVYRRLITVTDEWTKLLYLGLSKLGRFALFRKIKNAIFQRDVNHPFFASTLYYYTYILQVAKSLKSEKCDIVHLHNFSQFASVIRAFNPEIKIILHMDCDWLVQLDRTKIEHRLKQVDLIIGCSEYITRNIRLVFPQFARRCVTIYNGVDINHFVNRKSHLMMGKNDPKRILFVGRVSPEKGLHILINAFQEVVKSYPETQLEIVGPKSALPIEFIVTLSNNSQISNLAAFYGKTSYLSQLQELLISYGNTTNVTFTGFIPHTFLINYYHHADVLVNPSLTEAFGRSLVEAMACQVPVIATRVGGMIEILDDQKTGILVESGNAVDLAKAILRILSDKNLSVRMGKAARERVVNLFSWEKIAEGLLHQYRILCGVDG